MMLMHEKNNRTRTVKKDLKGQLEAIPSIGPCVYKTMSKNSLPSILHDLPFFRFCQCGIQHWPRLSSKPLHIL